MDGIANDQNQIAERVAVNAGHAESRLALAEAATARGDRVRVLDNLLEQALRQLRVGIEAAKNALADAGGEYSLDIVSQDGSGRPRTIDLEGNGFYEDPTWSPDGTTLAFVSDRVDGVSQIFLLESELGEARQLTALRNGVAEASCERARIGSTRGDLDGTQETYRS